MTTKFLWCDTETTGISPENSAPFQIAFVFCCTRIGGKTEKEVFTRTFVLNPLDIPEIEYSEEAGEVHGYSEEQIREFESAETVVPKIVQYLEENERYLDGAKMFFCGYNVGFDWDHLCSLFQKFGHDFSKYFLPQKLDVFKQVKKAGEMRVLPYLKNRKLMTVAEHLGINTDNAHDALSDIKVTREIAKSLAKMGVSLG